MMTLDQLRKKYSPAKASEVLESLVALYDHPKTPPDYIPPLLTVTLSSGYVFRAYVLSCGAHGGGEQTFVFSREIENEGDGAADLLYTSAQCIQSVTVWNVDDYPGTLPRFRKV